MIFELVDGRQLLYQWDLNRKLKVNDESIKEVHFCNRTGECSLVTEVVDGIANIPNILLQQNFDIRVYGYDGEATLHEEVFKVKARTRPDDYVYTETEVLTVSQLAEELRTEIEERLNEIEEGIITDGFATTDYVDEAINNVSVDLSGYAKESYVDEAITQVRSEHTTDLANYAKKTDIPDVSNFITEIPSEYITETELNAKGYLTNHQDISGKADVNHTHTGYANSKHTHDQADINGLQIALSEKATQADIDKAIELHNHNSLYAPIEHNHDDRYSTRGHVHSYNDLANKPTIPSIEGLASEKYVNAAIANIDIPEINLDEYATETYVKEAIEEAQLANKEIDLSDYATKTDLNGKADKVHNHTEYATKIHYHNQYLTQHQSLEDYAKKSDLFSKNYDDLINKPTIPSIEGLATEEYVEAAITKSETITAFRHRADNYYYIRAEDADKIYNNPLNYKLDYQNEEYRYDRRYVADLATYLLFVAYSFELDTTGAPALGSKNINVKTIRISTDNKIDGNYVITEVSNIDLASKDYVDEAINNIEIPGGGSTDLTNYYTKEETNQAIQTALNAIGVAEGGAY